MFFNSYLFVLLFLPVTVAGYFLCNRRSTLLGKFFLLLASLTFYGCFNVAYLPILCGSILANYLLAAGMRRLKGKTKKALLIAGISLNILLLLSFKYTNFFIENLNVVLQTDFVLLNLILPVGISFFTFQQLAFLTDSYRDAGLSYPLLDYALYVSFFPYIISGPIALHHQMIPQLQDTARKRFNPENFSKGLAAFSFGLAKKVLLADTFGPAADWAFANIAALNGVDAVLAMLAYTLQLYFDFSGYCDMSVGIGLMLNLEIPLNFHSPYRALSVTDFWKRWHITLTNFFTRYVYIPLGGNRKGTGRTYLNIMIIYLISGFWHGANWTFILWGVLHGVGSVVCRALHGKVKLPNWLKWLLTFGFVNCTWVFFRASSVHDALSLFKRMLVGGFGPVSPSFSENFLLPEAEFLVNLLHLPAGAVTLGLMVLFFAFALFASVRMKNTQERIGSAKYSGKFAAVCVALLVWSVLSFSGVTSFIYVNF